MEKFWESITKNKKLFYGAIVFFAALIISAFIQGRGITIGGLEITEKPEVSKPENNNTKIENIEIISHKGTLKIKVLKGTTPQVFYGAYVSCAKGKEKKLFSQGVTEYEVPIYNEDIVFINCKMFSGEGRWLADAVDPPLVMPEHSLEVNGRVLDDSFALKTTDVNANYKIRLTRK